MNSQLKPDFESSCQYKNKFETYKAALRGAKKSSTVTKHYRNRLEPYKCRYCAFYHVGKRKKELHGRRMMPYNRNGKDNEYKW